MKNVLRLTVYAEFCSLLLIAFFSSVSFSNVYAQNVQEMYRITDSKTFFAPPEPYEKSTFEAPPIPPGGERVLADIEGPGKITYWYATDSTKGRWNPGLVLRMYWDGAKEPSVNVPVSDFFGGFQSQTVDFSSYPMQVRENNFMCFLPMPFQKRARFVLYNESSEEYKDAFIYLIQYEKGDEYAEEKSRLHCRWNRENPVRDGMYEALDVRGKGSYVGHFLQVTAGHTSWWGEGDLIYTIDGERITSSCGREDEYGACWADGAWGTFSGPFSGHLLNTNGTRGRAETKFEPSTNRVYRWYCSNPIRFQKSLKIEIQNEDWVECFNDFTSVSFWYQEGAQGVTLAPLAERVRESMPELQQEESK